MYRKVALERVDDEVRAALAAVESARSAESRLDEIRRQIGELVLRMQDLERAKFEAARALARLEGISLVALYDSVPDTTGDQHAVERAALQRAQLAHEEAATTLAALEQEARALETRATGVSHAQKLLDQALLHKERWLRENDEELRLRLCDLEAERARLARLIAEIDRDLLMQRMHDPPPLQPFHVQILRERRRQAQARTRALEREHQSILLDGVTVATKQ